MLTAPMQTESFPLIDQPRISDRFSALSRLETLSRICFDECVPAEIREFIIRGLLNIQGDSRGISRLLEAHGYTYAMTSEHFARYNNYPDAVNKVWSNVQSVVRPASWGKSFTARHISLANLKTLSTPSHRKLQILDSEIDCNQFAYLHWHNGLEKLISDLIRQFPDFEEALQSTLFRTAVYAQTARRYQTSKGEIIKHTFELFFWHGEAQMTLQRLLAERTNAQQQNWTPAGLLHRLRPDLYSHIYASSQNRELRISQFEEAINFYLPQLIGLFSDSDKYELHLEVLDVLHDEVNGQEGFDEVSTDHFTALAVTEGLLLKLVEFVADANTGLVARLVETQEMLLDLEIEI